MSKKFSNVRLNTKHHLKFQFNLAKKIFFFATILW
jgi:hypothetical protein